MNYVTEMQIMTDDLHLIFLATYVTLIIRSCVELWLVYVDPYFRLEMWMPSDSNIQNKDGHDPHL